MAKDDQGSHPRLRVNGVAAHVRCGSVAFSCEVEELSVGGAFFRTDQLLPAGSDLQADLVKPGARKVLHLGGQVRGAFGSGLGQHPGLDVEFSAMTSDDSGRLGQWLDEMMARGTAKEITRPIAPVPAAPREGSAAPAPDAKLMTQIKGLLLEMDELRDRLRLREGEIDQRRRELATAEQLIGKRPT